MKIKKKLIISFTLATMFIGGSSYASDSNKSYQIYFSNGMMNSYEDAVAGAKELGKWLSLSPSNQNIPVVKVSYNESEFILTQLVEVFQQKAQDSEDFEQFWTWLYLHDQPVAWFREAVSSLLESAISLITFGGYDPDKDDDLQRHIATYKKEIDNGSSVVIVSHSQGNFYANFSYDALDLDGYPVDKKLRIIGVATPASRVGGNGPYTTLDNDSVMNGVRLGSQEHYRVIFWGR